MTLNNILLLILSHSALIFNANCAENNTMNDLRIFHYGTMIPFYSIGNDSADNRVALNIPLKINDLMSVDYHPDKKILYWSNSRHGYFTRSSTIRSIPWDYVFTCFGMDITKLRYSNATYCLTERLRVKTLREEENWNPRSLAIDYIGDKIYIADTAVRSINVLNLNGGDKTTVFEQEFLIPYEVALDPAEGLMFVYAANTKNGTLQIYRANMDGSSTQIIVDNADTLKLFVARDRLGFTLDTIGKRIYFANFNNETIESTDYDGNDRINVTSAKHPLSIGISNGSMYWSDSNTHASKLFMCFVKQCAMWTCKLNATGACDETTIKAFIEAKYLDRGPHAFKVFDKKAYVRKPNPCGSDNGGCEHHCLLKAGEADEDLGFGCSCNDGWKLTSSLKNCTRITANQTYIDFLVNYNTSFTELAELAESTSGNDIFPFPRNLMFRLFFEKTDTIMYHKPLDFIQVNKMGNAIVKRRISPDDALTPNVEFNYLISIMTNIVLIDDVSDYDITTVKAYYKNTVARALAYDWITKTLYHVKLTIGEEKGELIATKNEKFTGDEAEEIMLTKIDEPVSMVVHPYRGYLFASLKNGSIVRLKSDGSDERLIPNVNDSILLAVDLNDDKLYWLNKDRYVNYANLKGGDIKRLFKYEFVDYMYVFDKWLYLKNDKIKQVWRYDKNTGTHAGSLKITNQEFYRESIGIKVSAKDDHKPNADNHPCGYKNGDCEVFCFAVPQNESDELKKICRYGKE